MEGLGEINFDILVQLGFWELFNLRVGYIMQMVIMIILELINRLMIIIGLFNNNNNLVISVNFSLGIFVIEDLSFDFEMVLFSLLSYIEYMFSLSLLVSILLKSFGMVIWWEQGVVVLEQQQLKMVLILVRKSNKGLLGSVGNSY